MTEQHSLQSSQAKSRGKYVKKIIIPLLIVSIAVAIFSVMMVMAPKPEKKVIEQKPPLVSTMPLTSKQLILKVASQGTVIPEIKTSLIAEVSGRIVEVSPKFHNGGYFEKGEMILKINDEDYQVALLQSQARLNIAKAALLEQQARAKQAKEEWQLSGKPLSDAPIMALRKPQLQKAKADITAAEADLQSAKIKLSRTIITSPYDGLIKQKQVDIGQFVNIGTPLATSFSVERAEVRLPIKTQDIPFLVLPQIKQASLATSPIELTMANGNSSQTWQAELTRYEGEIDTMSRVHYVIATINDPYNLKGNNNKTELRVGSFVKAQIHGQLIDNISAIPRRAVIGKNSLHIVNGSNQLMIKSFSVLRSDRDFLYTKESFPDDWHIVLTELEAPVEGMSLRIIESSTLLAEESL